LHELNEFFKNYIIKLHEQKMLAFLKLEKFDKIKY